MIFKWDKNGVTFTWDEKYERILLASWLEAWSQLAADVERLRADGIEPR